MQTPVLRRSTLARHRNWDRCFRGLICIGLIWSAPVWGAAAVGGREASPDGLSNWPVQIDYRPPALSGMAFLPETHFALPPWLAAPGVEASSAKEIREGKRDQHRMKRMTLDVRCAPHGVRLCNLAASAHRR